MQQNEENLTGEMIMGNVKDFIENGVLIIPIRGLDIEEGTLVIPNNVKELFGQDGCWPEDIDTSVKRVEFEPGGNIEVQDSAFDFYYPNIQEIDFADSVKSIGYHAFPKKNLKEILLPEGRESIGGEAFTGCKKVEKIVIPDSVSSIGNGCFNGCEMLQSIECSRNNFDRFLDSFNAKNKLKMVLAYLEESYSCTSELGEQTIAYIQKNQKKIIDAIIEKDNDIAMGAFLALPIKEDRKYLKAVEKKAGSRVRGVLLNLFNKKEQPKKAENLILEDAPAKPKTLTEWKKVFKLTNIGEDEICVGTYKEYETSVTIPEMIGKRKVTKLENTFSGNTSITNVYLPDSLKEIGNYSFDGCSSLLQITIPRKTKNIGFCAFRGCSSLAEILIPKGVSTIDSRAFEDCINITSMIIPDSVKRIGKYEGGILWGSVFEGCKKLESIELSAKLKYIPDSAFRGCRNLKKVVLPNEVKEIGGFAFNGCEGLETITIPSSVKIISVDYAFGGCAKLKFQTPAGTYAEQYANDHGIPVVNIED